MTDIQPATTETTTTRMAIPMDAAEVERELSHDLTEQMRAAQRRMVPQSRGDYFVAGAAFGFALAIVFIAVIELATRH